MQIKVLSVDRPQSVQKGKRTYQTMDVSFKNIETGKTTGKTLVSFAYPEVWEFFKNVDANTDVNVTTEKIGDYWQWTAAESAVFSDKKESASDKPQSTSKWTPNPNQETPEEREWKQRRITRQASVNAAIAMLKTDKVALQMEPVLDVAAQIENWVNSRNLDFSVSNTPEIE